MGSTTPSKQLGGTFAHSATITQKQLETFLQDAVQRGGLKPNSQSIYNFMLPPGVILKDRLGTTSMDGMGGLSQQHQALRRPRGLLFGRCLHR